MNDLIICSFNIYTVLSKVQNQYTFKENMSNGLNFSHVPWHTACNLQYVHNSHSTDKSVLALFRGNQTICQACHSLFGTFLNCINPLKSCLCMIMLTLTTNNLLYKLFFKMDDALAIGTHCGSLDGTVTLNIQIKSGMKNFVSGQSVSRGLDWNWTSPIHGWIKSTKLFNCIWRIIKE